MLFSALSIALAGQAAADPGWGRPAPEPTPTATSTVEPTPPATPLADPGWG
ncbi:hypothetical protein ACFVU3_08195 [Streptomyces sp. NPDC058052]|uniref:hypothetical protein n=1 Tax=Streptomyces sp. NPDC058052 TaxID=3346316 RepID=UPI0036E83445